MDGPAVVVDEPGRLSLPGRTLRGLKGASEQRSRCLVCRHGVHGRCSRGAMGRDAMVDVCTVIDYKPVRFPAAILF
jgi:hypothetical protein